MDLTRVIEVFMKYLIFNWNIAINEKWRALYESWKTKKLIMKTIIMATFATQLAHV